MSFLDIDQTKPWRAYTIGLLTPSPNNKMIREQFNQFFKRNLNATYAHRGSWSISKVEEFYETILVHKLGHILAGQPTYWSTDINETPDLIELGVSKGIPHQSTMFDEQTHKLANIQEFPFCTADWKECYFGHSIKAQIWDRRSAWTFQRNYAGRSLYRNSKIFKEVYSSTTLKLLDKHRENYIGFPQGRIKFDETKKLL